MQRCVAVGMAVALAGCRGGDVSARCAVALVEAARASKVDARAAGTHAIVAGVDLEVVAKVESQGAAASQRVAGIRVAVYGPGAGKLLAGSVGVGASHAEAVETAVAEWVQLAGIAIVRALVLKERSSERYDLGGYVVYPGATGVRGPARPPWSAQSQRQLIGSLEPAFKELSPGELHSVSLAVVVNPSGPVEGECLVNGARSQAVLTAVAAYPWARLKTSYMFKQYYVVEKGR